MNSHPNLNGQITMKVITITVKLSDNQYEELRQQAQKEDWTPEGYLDNAVIETLQQTGVSPEGGWWDTDATVS